MMARCELCGCRGRVEYNFNICLASCAKCGHVWVTHWSVLMRAEIEEQLSLVNSAISILRDRVAIEVTPVGTKMLIIAESILDGVYI